jgi:hypothetical protein
LCASFVIVLAASLLADTKLTDTEPADANLRITDVGLHGYYSTTAAVRLALRNPSTEPRAVRLQITVSSEYGPTNTVTTDITLSGGEQRQLELPVLMPGGKTLVTANATSAGTSFAQDNHDGTPRQTNLIVLMCASEDICKNAQSQIQFSGTVEERADKNRQTKFEMIDDPRDHWWAYSVSSAVVLATPTAKFTPAQRLALEGFLRSGGRLVLLEDEIADPSFLAPYRIGTAPPKGERVGKGTLFRVSKPNALGDIFAGRDLPGFLAPQYAVWNSTQSGLLRDRFATAFEFPRLRWVLIWLTAYIVIIGVLNFAVLRHFRRLEFGWISMCGLALLFAAGFYLSSASRRPRSFRLDNLATYYLDSQSPLAAASYDLRISAPERRTVAVSIEDPAVFTYSNSRGEEPNSQIWTEINRSGAQQRHEYDILLGPPSKIDLPLLKWSFRDLDLRGLHEFPGTIHFIAPNRLRNDTGQQFGESVYLDYTSNASYALPALAPGAEIQLDTIVSKPIRTNDETPRVWNPQGRDFASQGLRELALSGTLPFTAWGKVFVGFSDGPALPVDLNIPHQQNVHSLIVVSLE